MMMSGPSLAKSQKLVVQHYTCNGFKITFVSEKHVVEDDVLFTNHLAGK